MLGYSFGGTVKRASFSTFRSRHLLERQLLPYDSIRSFSTFYFAGGSQLGKTAHCLLGIPLRSLLGLFSVGSVSQASFIHSITLYWLKTSRVFLCGLLLNSVLLHFIPLFQLHFQHRGSTLKGQPAAL
jgi:hypothetical protein